MTAPGSRTSPAGGRHLGGAAIAIFAFALCFALLLAIARYQADAPSTAAAIAGWIGTVATATGAAFSLQRGWRYASGRAPASSYRWAILIAIIAAAVTPALTGADPSLPYLLALGLGALAGGMAASWRDGGLWEDNYPPAPETLRFVLEAHRARLPALSGMPWGKRLLDIVGSGAGLILGSPLGLLVCCLLWLEDPGPLFFVKNSVGQGGRNFRQWKLRTMVRGAEAASGPVWSEQADQRVLRVGAVLRRTALDELPQLVNILTGQMSLVGPRPQRTVLVLEYLQRLPGYADRHRLPPGLAGLAQVAGHYYLTPLQKLRFDRLYLQHAGLGFDLKLILVAFAVVFWLRWRSGWNGRVPRSWLHGRRVST